MSACVLTLTYWSLWQPGRSVVDFTFRQSCVAPACFSTLRTSPLAQVCLKSAKVDKLALAFDSLNVVCSHLSNSRQYRCDLLFKLPIPDELAAWAYLCDLLSALQHLHSHGFVHLDLKPANVLITDSGCLKLADFGLLLELKQNKTELLEGKGKDDAQEGDPRYMAPELLRGEYGPAADVFRYK